MGHAFKFSIRATNIAAGANYDIGVQTGQFPLTIKSRILSSSGSTELVYSAYEDSAYTDGTPVFIGNQGRLSVRAPYFSVSQGVTTTAIGTQYLPYFSILSSGVNTQSRLGTETSGDETNLKANTKHIFRLSVPADSTAATVAFLSVLCYEGPLDYPL